MSAVAAALVEAWSEVRVHRARFVLSLIGVFLAVFAMTTVTALGLMGRQVVAESVERSAGRPATVSASVYSTGSQPLESSDLVAEYDELVERYDIRWASTVGYAEVRAQFPQGVQVVPVTTVQPDYAVLHRISAQDGRWFTDADEERYAPALVVNEAFMTALGPRDPAVPPTVLLTGETPVTATVVGVVSFSEYQPQAYMLAGDLARWGGTDTASQFGPPSLEVWVPPTDADAVVSAMQTDLSRPDGSRDASTYRSDAGSELEVLDLVLAYGVRAVSWFALLLGGVGVLNVGVVTVRQRIREIGVRRSFGATSARVFVTVMLESVCATAFAGAVAVALSVALVSNVPFESLLGDELSLTDVPPFPARAALEGFLAATAVGALAGLVPALIAVRAKVIDAIRY